MNVVDLEQRLHVFLEEVTSFLTVTLEGVILTSAQARERDVLMDHVRVLHDTVGNGPQCSPVPTSTNDDWDDPHYHRFDEIDGDDLSGGGWDSHSDIPMVAAINLEPTHCGWLNKKRKHTTGIKANLGPQKRWCCLKQGVFYYYMNDLSDKQQGHFLLEGYNVECINGKKPSDSCLKLTRPGERTYEFQFFEQNDIQKWVDALNREVKYSQNSPNALAQRRLPPLPGDKQFSPSYNSNISSSPKTSPFLHHQTTNHKGNTISPTNSDDDEEYDDVDPANPPFIPPRPPPLADVSANQVSIAGIKPPPMPSHLPKQLPARPPKGINITRGASPTIQHGPHPSQRGPLPLPGDQLDVQIPISRPQPDQGRQTVPDRRTHEAPKITTGHPIPHGKEKNAVSDDYYEPIMADLGYDGGDDSDSSADSYDDAISVKPPEKVTMRKKERNNTLLSDLSTESGFSSYSSSSSGLLSQVGLNNQKPNIGKVNNNSKPLSVQLALQSQLRRHLIGENKPSHTSPINSDQPSFISKLYVAEHDYTTDKADELQFKRGDLIKIIDKAFDSVDWWTGRIGGKTGLVPKTYLSEVYKAG